MDTAGGLAETPLSLWSPYRRGCDSTRHDRLSVEEGAGSRAAWVGARPTQTHE